MSHITDEKLLQNIINANQCHLIESVKVYANDGVMLTTLKTAIETSMCNNNLRIEVEVLSSSIREKNVSRLIDILTSKSCPINISLCMLEDETEDDAKLNEYRQNRSQFLVAIFGAMARGGFPEGCAINLIGVDLSLDCIKKLTIALQSKNCPQYLKISLGGETSMHRTELLTPDVVEALADGLAIRCGVRNLTLHLIESDRREDIRTKIFSSLLTYKHLAGLKLIFTTISDDGYSYELSSNSAKIIARALKSNACPANLKLDLSQYFFENNSIKFIINAISSLHCPQGLEIKINVNAPYLVDSRAKSLRIAEREQLELALVRSECRYAALTFNALSEVVQQVTHKNYPEDVIHECLSWIYPMFYVKEHDLYNDDFVTAEYKLAIRDVRQFNQQKNTAIQQFVHNDLTSAAIVLSLLFRITDIFSPNYPIDLLLNICTYIFPALCFEDCQNRLIKKTDFLLSQCKTIDELLFFAKSSSKTKSDPAFLMPLTKKQKIG